MVSTSLARALHKKRLEQEVENYRRHLEEMVAERTQQLREALREVERSYEHTLEALGVAIDLRDSSTAGHSRRVFLYSIEIAKALGGLEHELKNIAMGAWLHDIGKLAIPDAIAAQNRRCSSRPATGGRPGDNNGGRPDRAGRRFRLVIVTPSIKVLRRPLEFTLRTLVGVMDHASGPPRHERHVQGIEHQLLGERGGQGYRPSVQGLPPARRAGASHPARSGNFDFG